MSELIRQIMSAKKKSPAPALQPHEMDSISDAQRDFMRLPEGVAGQLWDGMLRPGDERDAVPQPLKPWSGWGAEDPNYPMDDKRVPPGHRRT